MSNFETDNQDKDNLVGDEKVMSDAVDREQLALKQSDEIASLKRQLDAANHLIMVYREKSRGES